MFVQHFFELDKETVEELREMTPEFGYNGFGEFLFYRTYSRKICDKCRKLLKYNKEEGKDYCRNCSYDFTIGQENWADVVIRNINGTFSIRKDWYIKNHILWEEDVWQHYARHMAISMFKMEWSPPGRGLWAMGTDFIYERGSMALNNCGYTEITDEIGKDVNWVMDALMCVPKSTWTLTNNGPRQISELIDKETNLIINGITYKTNGFFYSGQKEVFEIETYQGHKLQATGNHKILTNFLDCQVWQELKDLVPELEIYLNKHNNIEWDGDGTYEEGYILGWLYGDGTFCKQKSGFDDIKLFFHPDDFCMLDYITSLFKDYNISFNNYENRTENYVVWSKELVKLCEKFGVDKYKKINTFIEQASSEFLSGFISAFFDTDGSVATIDAAALLTQSNLERLEAVQRILLRFGINSSLKLDRLARENVNICGRICNQKPKYCLRIGKDNINRFIDRIGFKNPRKRKKLLLQTGQRNRIFTDKFSATIKSIKSIGIQDVYDVHVPGINAFDANGFVVHNCGVGIGFDPLPSDELKTYIPAGKYDHKISDDREGWCDATQARIDCYLSPGLLKPEFDYSGIRKANLPIRGFGGVSSGPEPLIYLHKQIDKFFEMYRTLDWYTVIHLKADIVNSVGCCVIAGNVRRSAELMKGKYKDIAELKNYERYPYREEWAGMSNNSISLETDEDFDYLIDIAESIKVNGEPGFINIRNFPFGRIGKKMKGLRLDRATGINPCGEQLLENKELCTLAITYPTRCKFDDVNDWLKACEYATMYACTVTLLPTHRPETNAVMLRNRRIGVDITDVSLWKHEIGITNLVKNLRKGYKRVRATGKWANSEAGVPGPIRFTTIKPGGTSPKLPGVRSGWQNPTFGYTLRRVRCPQNQNIFDILHNANVPHEPDVFSKNTEVFEFAIDQSAEGRVKPATEVSIWEQAMMLVLLQREWSDNAVSNTIYFRPKWNLVKDFNLKDSIYYDELDKYILDYLLHETLVSYADIFERREHESKEHKVKLEQDNYTDDWHLKIWKFDPNHEEDAIEGVLAAIAPLTKSVSVLPHSTVGAYRQMPEEGLTKEEYEERLSRIRKIDWTKYRGSDGIDEKFCEGPSCTILPG